MTIMTPTAATRLQAFARRLLGIDDHAALIAGQRADIDSLAGTLQRTVEALNNTSKMTASVQMRLAAYERHVPQIAKVGKALRENALRAERRRVAEAALAADPASDKPEMSEEVVGG